MNNARVLLLLAPLLIVGLAESFYCTDAARSQDFGSPLPVTPPLPVPGNTFPPPEPGLEPPPADPVNQLLEKQRLLEAQYNLLLRQLQLTKLQGTVVAPTTDTTRPLDSSTTDTEAGSFQTVESRILAYEAMNKVAGAIYKDIDDVEDINALIVYDKEIFSTITAYRLLKVKMQEFQRRYAEFQIVARSAAPGGTRSRGITDLSSLGLPTTFTRSILEFVALFRSQDRITFEPDFELNPNSLIAAIASHFQKDGQPTKVYNPGFYLMSLDRLDDSSLEGILGPDLANLILLRSRAADIYAGGALANLNREVDLFLESLLYADGEIDPSFNSPLLTVIQANQLGDILDDRGSYVLHLDIDVAGGSHRTRRSLFTTLFSGSRLSFSGGAVVNYSLFARDGSLKKSGFFYYNTGYKSMSGRKTNIK